ncbi:MAG: C40 family peptidase [Ilumatobacteraceae bacterium]
MSKPHRSRPRSFLRRVALTTVAVGSLLPALGSTTAAAAGPRSISPVLSGIAHRALDAADQLQGYDDLRSYDPRHVTYNSYVVLRDQAAALAASELGLPASEVRDAWAATALAKQTALLAALTQLGVAYRSHTSQPGVGFDCSGLTTYAWGVAGRQLSRQSRAQINESQRVERTAAEAGDLMYYPGHVMLFLGVGDAMVHSPYSGSEVEITFLSERHARGVVFADPTR